MAYLFVLSTVVCLLDLFASFIIKIITAWCFSESQSDQAIRCELIALKKKLDTISMVDEFAKYAKLQRQYNKLADEAKEKFQTRSATRGKLRFALSYGIRFLSGIFILILLYLYRHEPVIILPKGYLWPFGSILSWPTTVDNCISLQSWIILIKLTVSLYLQ